MALELTGDERAEIDQEGRCVITDHGAFVLFNIYGPAITATDEATVESRSRYKLRFYQALQARAEALREAGRAVVLAGGALPRLVARAAPCRQRTFLCPRQTSTSAQRSWTAATRATGTSSTRGRTASGCGAGWRAGRFATCSASSTPTGRQGPGCARWDDRAIGRAPPAAGRLHVLEHQDGGKGEQLGHADRPHPGRGPSVGPPLCGCMGHVLRDPVAGPGVGSRPGARRGPGPGTGATAGGPVPLLCQLVLRRPAEVREGHARAGRRRRWRRRRRRRRRGGRAGQQAAEDRGWGGRTCQASAADPCLVLRAGSARCQPGRPRGACRGPTGL